MTKQGVYPGAVFRLMLVLPRSHSSASEIKSSSTDGADRCAHSLETIGAGFCEVVRRYDSVDNLIEDSQNENWSTIKKRNVTASSHSFRRSWKI